MDCQDRLHHSQEKPSLSEFLSLLLGRQAEAHSLGLGFLPGQAAVFPHDAVPPPPTDPRQAWEDGTAASAFLLEPGFSWKTPPDWPSLVHLIPSRTAVPFCLGNFPQMVRQIHPFLEMNPLGSEGPLAPLPSPALFDDWLESQVDDYGLFLQAAVDRLLGNFQRAEARLARAFPSHLQVFGFNEQSALAWHKGQHQLALNIWKDLPDPVPIWFNRGMAYLFLGDRPRAITSLDAALSGMEDSSAWHHLACLYRTLAEG